ncbi:MAG TPA: hypothetical protein VNV43_08635 [Candidatus Acidoferrales bacterium]|nr:hypothetical protein [Candidatus Acidoferrales bacterium]
MKKSSAPMFSRRREQAEAFSIELEKSNARKIVASKELHLFWKFELLTDNERSCNEDDYIRLWNKKISNELMYQAVTQSPLQFYAEGRLADIILYLILFENPEKETEIIVAIQNQTFKSTILNNWNDLLSNVTVNLDARKRTILQNLSDEYGVALTFSELLAKL